MAEMKTSGRRIFKGRLMNMGRGGVMLKTNGSLPLNDPPRIRIGVEKLERSGAAVLVGKIVWSVRAEYHHFFKHDILFICLWNKCCPRVIQPSTTEI